VFLFFLILLLLFILAIIEIYEKKVVHFIPLIFLAFLFSVFGGLKKVGISKDDLNYVTSFEAIQSIRDYFVAFSEWSFHEPSFHFIVVFLKFIFATQYHWYFFVFVSMAVIMKFFIFYKYADSFYALLMLYFAIIFPVHEMTQIRVSVGSAFVMYSWFLYSENKKKKTLFFLLIAFLFHYSSLIGFVVFALKRDKSSIYFYSIVLALAVFGVIFKFDSKDIIISMRISGISDKLAAYKAAEDAGLVSYDDSKIFNVIFISRLALAAFFIFVSTYADKNSWFQIFLKIYLLSISLYLLLSADPSVAVRVGDLLGLSCIFLLAGSIRYFKFKIIPLSIMFLYSLTVLCISLYNDKLFTTYKFFFQ
jgi:hypothetical protein